MDSLDSLVAVSGPLVGGWTWTWRIIPAFCPMSNGVGRRQDEWRALDGILSLMQPISLYFHIPFCIHRCAYCDFNTYAGLDHLIPEYVEALCSELEYLSNSVHDTQVVKTIFFGGGTPSLLPAKQLERVRWR